MPATQLEPTRPAPPSFVVVSTPAHETPVSDGNSSDANLTPPATPIFQPSTLYPEPTVLIIFTSYAHHSRLSTRSPPNLQYNLHTFTSPSPEKRVSKYDGRELLGKVEEEILTRGRGLEQEAMVEKTEREKVEREDSEKAAAQKKAAEEEALKSAVTEAVETSEAAVVEKMEALGLEDAEPQVIPLKVLRIGVSSEMGLDCSVAFVEELGSKKRPVEWEVEVLQRHVDKQRDPCKGKARGGGKGCRRKNMRLTNEE